MTPAGGCVRPGLHGPRIGTHAVAWWDPNVLALDAEENVGVRQQRILEADESGTEVARGEQAYVQWKEGRSAAIAQASRPSITVQTATTFAAGAAVSEPDLARIQIEKVSRVDIERPSGRRFTTEQKPMIGFERVERLLQRARRGLHRLGFRWR